MNNKEDRVYWYENVTDQDRYNLRVCSRTINDSILELQSDKTTDYRKEKLNKAIEDSKQTINDILYLYE